MKRQFDWTTPFLSGFCRCNLLRKGYIKEAGQGRYLDENELCFHVQRLERSVDGELTKSVMSCNKWFMCFIVTEWVPSLKKQINLRASGVYIPGSNPSAVKYCEVLLWWVNMREKVAAEVEQMYRRVYKK